MEAANRIASSGSNPVLPGAGVVMDREFIIKNQIVERYITGRLPPKGVTDFERVIRANPGLIEELGIPERVNAAQHLEALIDRQVDGVIIAGVAAATLPRDDLQRLNVVLINQPSEEYSAVGGDSLAAGRIAAEHLLELGHEQIAFIGPSTSLPAFRLRERGFAEALRTRGLTTPSDYWRRSEATVNGGKEAMRALLALDQPPTAVFCPTDIIALGAHKAASKAGAKLGTELSLLGCDDIEMNTLVSPELTSIRVPQRELGALAVRQIIHQLDGTSDGQRVSTHILPVKLMKRGTTGRLRRR